MLSRVKRTGFSLDLMAEDKAMQVALFLEKSPTKIEKSAEEAKLFRTLDLSKEPESVDLRKVISGNGGTLFFKESGSKI